MRRISGGVIPRSEIYLVVALAVVGGAAAWFRLPPITRRTVWAEDGTIFLGDAITGNPLDHLFAGYAGYLQFVPRLLADFSLWVGGLPGAGIAINLASCVVAGLVAALVYWCARDVVPSAPLRTVVAAITVLAPLVPIEILGNAANIHWLLLWMMLWVMLYSPRTRIGAWLLTVVAVVAALSEIQLAIFLPLFLTRRRVPHIWLPRVGLALGLAAQVVTTLLSPRIAHGGGLGGVLRNFVAQVVLANFDANRGVLERLLGTYAVLWEVLALVPFLIALVVVIRFGTPLQRIAVIYLVPGAFVLWTVAGFLNGWGGASLRPAPFAFVRYAVVPSMFVLASIVLAAQVLIRRHRSVWTAIGVLAASALVVLMLVQFVPSETTRSHGPTWAAAIRAAEKSCTSSPGSLTREIVTAPHNAHALWLVPIRCSQLSE